MVVGELGGVSGLSSPSFLPFDGEFLSDFFEFSGFIAMGFPLFSHEENPVGVSEE